ncbi:hypothetical protein V493_01699 [Pseudogymnoascus sp. VKM F-4281 (FW-2241)]|nr:hypothetical protein V493_01699 [Pseudogymnoascus sp. VKM F-4281 (FW-2241)]
MSTPTTFANVSGDDFLPPVNQLAILDVFFPGFSTVSAGLSKYLQIDISFYLPFIVICGIVIYASNYVSEHLWSSLQHYLMSTADIRIDDEMYNYVMGWVTQQKFSQANRRFIASTNINSRSWLLWYENREDERDREGVDDIDENGIPIAKHRHRKLRYTPGLGTHIFWYKGRLMVFRRSAPSSRGYVPISEREEISISSFGRDPTKLKELLNECRKLFLDSDEDKTVIFRGGNKPGTMSETAWVRSTARVSRPMSTVVMDESTKADLLADMRDYLHPHTQRWYWNRGIPYRRGYLLYGAPGTGKSSLSLAIAGYFKLKIYIVSLNSPSMNEESLGTLFSELPQRCVVLLEDIDTAGLTNARNSEASEDEAAVKKVQKDPSQPPSLVVGAPAAGRISLSALLNVLDGVSSQEGRILIMTTNHIDKLDEALIRPGRVDMTIQFQLSDAAMMRTLFTSIFTTLEGDFPQAKTTMRDSHSNGSLQNGRAKSISAEKSSGDEQNADEEEEHRKLEAKKIEDLAESFTRAMPEGVFSPAEVQGYLLKHKRSPEIAAREAAKWAKDTIEERKKKKEEEERKTRKRLEDAQVAVMTAQAAAEKRIEAGKKAEDDKKDSDDS